MLSDGISDTAPIRKEPEPLATISSRPLSVERPARNRSGNVTYSAAIFSIATDCLIVAPPPHTRLTSTGPAPVRVLEDGTTVVAQSGESAADHGLKGSVTFLAGSPGQGFGSPSDRTAGFAVERSLLT